MSKKKNARVLYAMAPMTEGTINARQEVEDALISAKSG